MHFDLFSAKPSAYSYPTHWKSAPQMLRYRLVFCFYSTVAFYKDKSQPEQITALFLMNWACTNTAHPQSLPML